MLMILLKLLVYGHLGFLIEIWFTGIHSVIFDKDKNATAVTYLPMCLVYGVASLILEAVSDVLPWPFYFKAFVYVFIIYLMEGTSGWLLKKLTGRIPWEYPKSFWAPMQLINLKYFPFWFGVALAFDPITSFLTKLLRAVALVA